MGLKLRLALNACAILVAWGAALKAVGQQSAPDATVNAPQFEEPQLIPSQAPSTPQEKCKRVRYSTVNFSLMIDEQGAPRQLRLLNPQDTDEDLFAIDAVIKDRFVPAREDGKARSVRRSIAVEVDTCLERVKGADGDKFDRLRLVGIPSQILQSGRDSGPPDEANAVTTASDAGQRGEANGEKSAGPYRVGGPVAAPVPIYTPEARYTNAARKRRVQGVCQIKLIVDANGVPQNLQVIRSLDSGLDQNALDAVRRYRFNPGVKERVGPVPVIITIAVRFRLY